ncbi:MAG: class I SAM-dependent methyltransferase [Chlamydiia bacterium]|nr:class I SAM-dependent methyltransferase [Chlamydiia bacterium]
MSTPSYSPHIHFTHFIWKQFLTPNDVVIDATCGNGHDTLYLAKLFLKKLYAIDIQKNAIEKTQLLLNTHLSKEEKASVELIQMSHEDLDQICLNGFLKLIVYNLGYLPGSDKIVKTNKTSTLTSLQKGISLLETGGALSITCYPNHAEGEEEEIAILEWAKDLPSSCWEVRHHRWINRPSRSPSVLWIQSCIR